MTTPATRLLPNHSCGMRVFPNGIKIHTSMKDLCANTGGDVWKGGALLAHYFERNPDLVRSKNVLELGCGTGYLGLCMAQLGAENLVLTDKEEMLGLLQRNLSANRTKIPEGCNVVTSSFDWENREEALRIRDALIPRGIDLIVATDVVYEEDGANALIAALEVLLLQNERDCPSMYLCLSYRSCKLEPSFWNEMEKRFSVENLSSFVTEDALVSSLNDRVKEIGLFLIKKKKKKNEN